MPKLDPNSVVNFGSCLSGTADFSTCPYEGYTTPKAWLDGLMDPRMRTDLLTHPPCSMSGKDTATVQAALDTLATFTFEESGKDVIFWDYIVGLFSLRSTVRSSAAKELAATAAQLARDEPNLPIGDVASKAELIHLLKALNGGY